MKTRKNTTTLSFVTEAELTQILADAQAASDPYTIWAVQQARRGDAACQLACAAILGR